MVDALVDPQPGDSTRLLSHSGQHTALNENLRAAAEAFANGASERTLRLLLAAVTFARDLNDRLRVVVDNQVATTLNDGPFLHSSATAGTYRLWNDVRAVFTMDPREIQRQQSLINGEIARQKWTFI